MNRSTNGLRHFKCPREVGYRATVPYYLNPRQYPSQCHRTRRWTSTQPASRPLRTALFFPGQGVQRVGMADPWLAAFPATTKPFLEELDSILKVPLSKIIADGPNSRLNATENSQPGIMAISILILRILENDFGFDIAKRVDVTLGHSLGEFAALVAGGYLDYSFALKLVRHRGEIMGQCTRDASERSGESYGMVALVCEPDRLDGLIATIDEFLEPGSEGSKDDSSHEDAPIQQVHIANINSKNQIVLSGSLEHIKSLLVQLRQFSGHDPRAVILNSDSPFHSPIMAPATEYMKRTLANAEVNFPGILPCISNVSALPFQSADDVRHLLSEQAVATVRWWDSIKYLHQERRVKRWIGIGPGKVGRNIVGKEVGRASTRSGGVWGISDPREIEEMLRAVEESEKEDRLDLDGWSGSEKQEQEQTKARR